MYRQIVLMSGFIGLMHCCSGQSKRSGVPIDTGLGDFVVLNDGDTLKGEGLKVRWENQPDAIFVYDGKKLDDFKYKAYQSKWGFSSRFIEQEEYCADCNPFYHMIRKGKISAYFTVTTKSIGVKLGFQLVYSFYYQEDGKSIMHFDAVVYLKRLIQDNPAALQEYDNNLEDLSITKEKKLDDQVKAVLKVIDIYNN